MGIFKLNGIDYMGGGGGGNANEEVLTWAEYCALTEEEKANGTTYYITDINGDGQSFQPVVFSFEEREIGVYGDGKPLYSQTFAKTIASSPDADSSSFLVASNIDYIDTLVNIWGSVCRPEGDAYSGSTGLIMGGGWQYSFHINPSHQLVVWTGTNSSYYQSIAGGNAVVTIQYTKSTDQPGSGTWTPQGVPAVHYSTDEHVVGTWIDGSTVYERTITVSDFSADQSESRLSGYWGYVDISSYVQNPSHVFVDIIHTYITLQDTTTRIPLYADWQGGNTFGLLFPFVSRTGTLTVTIRYTKST